MQIASGWVGRLDQSRLFLPRSAFSLLFVGNRIEHSRQFIPDKHFAEPGTALPAGSENAHYPHRFGIHPGNSLLYSKDMRRLNPVSNY
jgi:hypothetical protein